MANQSGPLRALARLGFAVNGLLHILIGWIAIKVALGTSAAEADQSGALAQVAKAPGGKFVLWVVVVGFAALGAWYIVSAFMFTGPDPKKRVWGFITDVGRGVVYIALAFTALTFAKGGSSSAAGSTSSTSASILSTPGGVILILAIGAIVFAIGVYFIAKGLRRSFKDDISVPAGKAGDTTIMLGVVGYVAKGIALGVVGALFVVAARTVNPSKATGLDGALKTLAALPSGRVVLFVIGIGLIAYGLYCFVRARFAKL